MPESFRLSYPDSQISESSKDTPLCPVFGSCGGCQYQDRTYAAERTLKQDYLSDILRQNSSGLTFESLAPIVASPRFYEYRHVLDLNLLRIRSGEIFVGFSPAGRNRVMAVDSCPIAMRTISDFLPELKKQAAARLTPRYRNANLVVKTGDDGRVLWGGIGRRSLQLDEKDYLWTEIGGKRIFYSLDTFFQANLFILPALMERIRSLGVLDLETVFYDLYGGVGLFGVALSSLVRRVILIEENKAATKAAAYNRQFNGLENFHIISGRVEERLFRFPEDEKAVVMVDPPRAGLSPAVIELLSGDPRPRAVLYLSCNPLTFARDISHFARKGWKVSSIIPFDFFPRTSHIEMLGLLTCNRHPTGDPTGEKSAEGR